MTTLTENRYGKLYWEVLRKQGILKEILLEWLQIIELKIKLYRERQQLLVMSELMLSDIGITRDEANAEAQSTDIPQQRVSELRKAG
mgnify:CR=1 FL=1